MENTDQTEQEQQSQSTSSPELVTSNSISTEGRESYCKEITFSHRDLIPTPEECHAENQSMVTLTCTDCAHEFEIKVDNHSRYGSKWHTSQKNTESGKQAFEVKIEEPVCNKNEHAKKPCYTKKMPYMLKYKQKELDPVIIVDGIKQAGMEFFPIMLLMVALHYWWLKRRARQAH